MIESGFEMKPIQSNQPKQPDRRFSSDQWRVQSQQNKKKNVMRNFCNMSLKLCLKFQNLFVLYR